MSTERKQVHALVSPEAHHRMHSTCGKQGVSVSAMIEVVLEDLDELFGDAAMRLKERASEIDAERRKHKGKGKAA